MSDKMVKRFEIAAYSAIIIMSLIAAAILVRTYLLPRRTSLTDIKIPAGSKVGLNQDWARSDKTLILVLSVTCHFCDESAPFYRKLMAEFPDRKKLGVLAVFPQDPESATKHLATLGLSVEEIRQATLASLGTAGTPTLILVDSSGRAIESWIGKLPPEQETRVLERLRG